MSALAKILIGAILILVGLGFFFDSPGIGLNIIPSMKIGGVDIGGIDWLGNFFDLITGMIPPFLILIGLFVVWLELDEMKIQKELKAEDKAEKKGKKEEIKEQAKK